MSDDYIHPGDYVPLSKDELGALCPEEQREVMSEWFRRHFEDPAEMTPYESKEGGYIWIWGGPYDAHEELEWEFGEIVDDSTIEDLARELTAECPQWAPGPEHPNLADGFVDVLASSVPLQSFQSRVETLQNLARSDFPSEVEQAQFQLLFAAAVSALEAYLLERAVRGVRQHEVVLKRFIEKHPKFKEHRVPVAEVLKMASGLESYASNVLSGMVWHRLGEARRIFEHAFDVESFPDTEGIEELIQIRHDIVHRAGRKKDGTPIELERNDVLRAFDAVERFVKELEPQLPIDDDTELSAVVRPGRHEAG